MVPEMRIAVEIEGGTLFGMAEIAAILAANAASSLWIACTEYNRAAREGWRVFRYTTSTHGDEVTCFGAGN